NPEPESRSPNPENRNLDLEPRNTPASRNPKPEIPKPESSNPKPETLTPHPKRRRRLNQVALVRESVRDVIIRVSNTLHHVLNPPEPWGRRTGATTEFMRTRHVVYEGRQGLGAGAYMAAVLVLMTVFLTGGG
ncbi:hypothetical protein T484DRAFT_1633763, partial [Baffinella frigidus]